MIGTKRKTIGVFINRTDTYFEECVQSIVQQDAMNLGYNVVFFHTVGYRGSTNHYDEFEKVMFSFAPVDRLDGIIVTSDAYEMAGFRELLMDMLRRANCPVVCVRDQTAPFHRLYTDEKDSLRPLLRHLLDDHGYRRIHFLAGFQGHQDSEARLNCYLEEMAKRKIPLPQNAIHYGTMWRSRANEAYEHFFENTTERPEVVVCANDYMALALVEELQRHGLSVPADVAVTGFDNIDESRFSAPLLTTVEQDYQSMVVRSVELLDQLIHAWEEGNADPEPKVIEMPSKTVVRESCGCIKKDSYAGQQSELSRYSRQMQGIYQREVAQMYFSIDGNACSTLEELHEVIMRKYRDIRHMKGFYLCLFEDTDQNGDEPVFAEKMTDNVRLVSALREREDLGMPMTRFDRTQLLPDEVWEYDKPQTFYVRLLHQRESVYGYAMTQYDEGGMPTLFYHHWNVIVSSALLNVFAQMKLQKLYEERRISSITDMLTGLNNRRGIEEQLAPVWDDLCARGETVSFFAFDLDNLKPINDTYGHEAGDYALMLVSQAIKESSSQTGTAARTGGDEFLLFMQGCDEWEAERFVHSFKETLRRMNQENDKPYNVGASVGSYSVELKPGMTIADCTRESDERMYLAKRKRERGMFTP
ncbi:MAG: GGDEF domain-containing protein [Clostridiales bacterium]|nr:GGDEF domain-containing protein [Clostridiales bacterium]